MQSKLSNTPVNLAILTVSDTRNEKDDRSGDLLQSRITEAGHNLVSRDLVEDDVEKIVLKLSQWIDEPNVDVIITTGGTGITGRDVTPEAVARLWDKEIPGFGELFRWISYKIRATSTIQSRACAGVAKGTYIFSLPGSPSACRDGWDQILCFQLDSGHRPCNLVELMPRLREK